MLWKCCSAAGIGRIVRIKGKINGAKYKEILDEIPAPECSGPQNMVKVHLPTGQRN
jgi:hypothetical protein